MDGVDRGRGLWRELKQRLGLKGVIGFCGSSSWRSTGSSLRARFLEEPLAGQIPAPERESEGPPVGRASSGMNLAAALAAERNLAAEAAGLMPLRALMRLAEETDGQDRKRRKMDGGDGGTVDAVCCVCMERNKGAAFIPCGHTYCRVCSRELWLNRGSCPLCNHAISQILDIF
ncbi:uncharacterized protein LOC127791474 [Diospyros lotus]|uniref:uncharacterized protein LOC127791474 n=1 Tax=Diospyros lotus TaxID=55363 RepID=UPI00224C9378|nr:uncharacterized protein LOC127791474 [Diospyros lotus]